MKNEVRSILYVGNGKTITYYQDGRKVVNDSGITVQAWLLKNGLKRYITDKGTRSTINPQFEE